MKIEKQIIVNKSIEDAWKVLGTDFATAHIWASPLINCQANDNKSFNGSSCTERICDIKGTGKTKEKLLQFSNDTHSLNYVVEGMPEVVTHATNTWWLTSINAAQTKLNMKMEVALSGFMGKLMQPMMKIMLGKMFSTIIIDFKYYVENGRPSEAKLRAQK